MLLLHAQLLQIQIAERRAVPKMNISIRIALILIQTVVLKLHQEVLVMICMCLHNSGTVVMSNGLTRIITGETIHPLPLLTAVMIVHLHVPLRPAGLTLLHEAVHLQGVVHPVTPPAVLLHPLMEVEAEAQEVAAVALVVAVAADVNNTQRKTT